MKVLLITQYFYPENFKSNDIAFEMRKQGYEVDVLAGIPNYPEGKYYKGYGLFRKRIEKVEGVNIYRAFQFSRGKNGNGIRLSFNYLSYAFCASFWALFLSLFKKYDAIIVHEPSPITQGIPAVIAKKIRKTPIYFWVLDIWPNAMMSGGNIKNKRLLNGVNNLVKFIYNNSDKILISSKKFEPLILSQGDYQHKILYFPNWSEDLLAMDNQYPIPELPDGFRIMFAGNIGTAQDIENVMKAVLELKEEPNLKWIFIGDGSKKEWLDSFIKENGLEQIVYTYGKYPFDAMPAFYNKANAMLLSLRGGEFVHLKAVVPAKLQSYMSAGRPVLAMIDGGGAEIISEAICGYSVASGDYISFAEMIKTKVLPHKTEFQLLGNNGRAYYEAHFRKEDCIKNLCNIIKNGN